jgi:hypothetical protein
MSGGISFKKEIPDYMAAIEIAEMMRALRTERTHARKQLKKLDKVIAVLRGLSTNSVPTRNGRKRKMSPAARRKIGAAQRKRWAKFHKLRAAKG